MADRLFEFGLRTKNGEKWCKSKVRWFLTNKLYMGIMVWSWTIYEGKYQPLVSPEVFRQVAVRLKERSKPHKVRQFQDFPLRSIFRCSCGSMLLFAAAPLLLLSGLPVAGALAFGVDSRTLAAISTINAAGACADIVILVLLLYEVPRGAIIRNHG